MSNLLTLLRRELGSYFSSVLGYVVLLAFLFIMGWIFSEIVGVFHEHSAPVGPMEALFHMFWFPSLFLIPAITMRLLSEEKRSGTLEMLMTAPVTDFQVVFAKYLGAVCLYTFMWALTGFYVLILHHFAGITGSLDLKQVMAGYIGVLAMGQFFIAIGLFASSLTRNQVVGAAISVAIIFVLILVSMWQADSSSGALSTFIKYVSPFEHIRDFSRGMVDLRPLMFYATGTVMALFVTTRVVESRKWR
jgi:ABC-2 type transport system permease protein